MTAMLNELGYIGFEVSDLIAWDRFAGDVLGLGVADGPVPDTRWLRMDERACRLILTRGPLDDVAFCGWRVAEAAAFDAFAAHLAREGVAWRSGDAAECALRAVDRLLVFADPTGFRHEAFLGPMLGPRPFTSPRVASGFVTGDGGLGHAVFGSNDYAASVDFAQRVLGAAMSDIIRQPLRGGVIEVAFLHLNERHHSIAFSDRQGAKQLHHFMIEVGDMADVGLARDRHRTAGLGIAQDIGQHPNDRMISYYGVTPSGFLIEFGYGGVKIDDATWQFATYPNLSDWGHHPPAS